jgi:hypothetical protein
MQMPLGDDSLSNLDCLNAFHKSVGPELTVRAMLETLHEDRRSPLVQIVPFLIIGFVRLVDLIFGVGDEFESGAFQTDVVRKDALSVYQNPIALTRLDDLNYPKERSPDRRAVDLADGQFQTTRRVRRVALIRHLYPHCFVIVRDELVLPDPQIGRSRRSGSSSGQRLQHTDEETYQTDYFLQHFYTLLGKRHSLEGRVNAQS